MRVNFPAYNHWTRQKHHYIKDKLIELGCEILGEENNKILAEVPDTWYFVVKTDYHVEVYSDSTYSKKVCTIKENYNTGRMLTLFDDKHENSK